MKKTLMVGLLGVLLGAGAAVASATVGAEEAAAAPCCSSCSDDCSYCGDDLACQTDCERINNNCWRWCSFSC